MRGDKNGSTGVTFLNDVPYIPTRQRILAVHEFSEIFTNGTVKRTYETTGSLINAADF